VIRDGQESWKSLKCNTIGMPSQLNLNYNDKRCSTPLISGRREAVDSEDCGMELGYIRVQYSIWLLTIVGRLDAQTVDQVKAYGSTMNQCVLLS